MDAILDFLFKTFFGGIILIILGIGFLFYTMRDNEMYKNESLYGKAQHFKGYIGAGGLILAGIVAIIRSIL